jgi:zinc protease
VPSIYHDVSAAQQSFETPDKANAVFSTGMNLKLRDDDPDYPALVLGNYVLGSGLNSRLFRRIRQKEGLSYGVGSNVNVSSLDSAGTFTGFAIYAPQNAAKVEVAFKEEVAKAVKEEFTEDEVKTAKSGWLQSRQVSRAQDFSLAGQLSNYLFLNRKLDWDAELEKKVAALTSEQITAAMRKNIEPAKLSIVKAGDFKK